MGQLLQLANNEMLKECDCPAKYFCSCCEELPAVQRDCTNHCSLSALSVHSTLLYDFTILMWLQMNSRPAACLHGAPRLFIKHMAVECIHIAVPCSAHSPSAATHWLSSPFPFAAVVKVTYQTTAEEFGGDLLAKVHSGLQMTSHVASWFIFIYWKWIAGRIMIQVELMLWFCAVITLDELLLLSSCTRVFTEQWSCNHARNASGL